MTAATVQPVSYPPDPAATVSLLQRVRPEFIRYTVEWLAPQLRALVEQRRQELTEIELLDYLESATVDFRLANGKSIPDCYVDDHPTLAEEERKLILSWNDKIFSVFRIDGTDPASPRVYRARNLVDDLDCFLVNSSAGDQVQLFPVGSYVATHAAPTGPFMALTGMQRLMPGGEPRVPAGLAARIALSSPRQFFRKPAQLAWGWELQQLRHDHFLQRFGAAWLVGPPKQMIESFSEFFNNFNEMEQPGDDPEGLIRRVRCARKPFIRDDLYELQSLGLFSDPRCGFVMLSAFDDLLKALTSATTEYSAGQISLCKGYLDDEQIPPELFERLGEQYPAPLERLLRRVLLNPSFDWGRDGVELLRLRKPRWYAQERWPAVLSLTQPLAEGWLFLEERDQQREESARRRTKKAGRRAGGRSRPRRS